MIKDNLTLEYYNKNYKNFIKDTVTIDFSEIQNEFLSNIDKGKNILDFGCGSGRDSKIFKEKGYNVTALDGSKELCKFASDYIGQKVIFQKFEEFNLDLKFDGIWASASLLHLDNNNLNVVINKLFDSLNENGIMYCSFKYGNFSGYKNGRFFMYLNEDSFNDLIKNTKNITVYKEWITNDLRNDRQDELWLNVLLIKNS